MKKISIFILLLVTSFGFYSCEKSGTEVILDPANVTAPQLESPAEGTSLVFTKENSDSTILFTWSSAQYGFSAAVDYYVQVDKQGNDFKKALTVGHVKSKDSLQVIVNDLNNQILLLETDPDVPDPVDAAFRVIAIVNSHVDTVFSKTVNMTITPFYIPIVYPQLYVPGAYQGWNPATADSIGSLNSDGNYEGYIYMEATTVPIEFKFTSARDWSHINYGDGGTPGTLSTDGGAGNLKVPESGYYKFNVNTNDLTWSYLKTTWAVIGDATPGGWTTDTPMTYDPDTHEWKVTMDLTVGELKFRANGSWDLNYGSNDNNGRLDQNGKNIQVSVAGNYTIILNLDHTVYKYSLIKN
ncbi:SusE domain-containing protein [Candidatus Sulfidibacterium hydrothermale]|uniref:SusE domain-containing protein n=1 Tax=Candidatus Sulfidibacterium hydrothermale TaxID=2875962 RepID=UPI001F0A9096|nr:SusE domain-containing protein [Candidatus Sulfidibacterium hydrothermale]UBM62828.1 SusE domain-containing protein [Candidatus Sulfidibacterium hydrothermale]